VTHVTQHCSQFHHFPCAHGSKRHSRIQTRRLALELTGDHHEQTPANVILVKDHIA
jgi:hypothetical protein